jgi:hypothetical protein
VSVAEEALDRMGAGFEDHARGEETLMTPMDCGLPALQLDGIIGEAEWAAAAIHDIGGVVFRVARLGGVLCIAVERAGGGHFTDLYLAGPGGEILNLHASMQLGERRLSAEHGWNAASPAFTWGTPIGWRANTVVRKPDADPAAPFVEQLLTYDGQEFAVDLEALGRGPWRLRIEVSSFGDGAPVAAWPAGADSVDTSGWTVMD